MPRHPGNNKETFATNETIGHGDPFTLDEIKASPGIEVVAESNIAGAADMEAFMNEILTIVVYEDNVEGSLPTVEPTVKGMKQVIVRGANSKVRRKYVEALARSRTTKYDQVQRDMTDRSSMMMKPKARMTYPFSVIHDPNPRGPAWLKAILAEA
jgi:hypothetical protein